MKGGNFQNITINLKTTNQAAYDDHSFLSESFSSLWITIGEKICNHTDEFFKPEPATWVNFTCEDNAIGDVLKIWHHWPASLSFCGLEVWGD